MKERLLLVTTNVDPSSTPLTPEELHRVLKLGAYVSIGVRNLEAQGATKVISFTLAANCSAIQGYCAEIMVLTGRVIDQYTSGGR